MLPEQISSEGAVVMGRMDHLAKRVHEFFGVVCGMLPTGSEVRAC